MSKQQELVEASFQFRARLLEMNACTFSAIDLEAIPVDVAHVTALSQQEVPYYSAREKEQETPDTSLFHRLLH